LELFCSHQMDYRKVPYLLDVNVENNIIIDKTLIKNYIKGEISFHTLRKMETIKSQKSQLIFM